MHEFTLALVGSINTFILHHYFLRRMPLVDTPRNGWFLQLNKFQVHGDHGYCVLKHRSLSDVVHVVDSTHTIGYGGWFWWQKTLWTAAPGKVAFPRSCRLPSARHPTGFSPFLYLSKVFYTRLEVLPPRITVSWYLSWESTAGCGPLPAT